MQVPASVKPAIWGAVGGAVAAMIIGFGWGGWVTGGTAEKMVTAGAQDATVLVLQPGLSVVLGGEEEAHDDASGGARLGARTG